jgi:hypothetical protein
MNITRELIQLKIKQYQNQRDKRANEMSNEPATYNGAIEALEQLLQETVEEPPINGRVTEKLAEELQ